MADVEQSRAPVTKVAAATAGAALATVICLVASIWVDVPTGLEGALATVFAFGAGYIAPPKSSTSTEETP